MTALEKLQSSTGKAFAASPSPFMHWLNPTIISAASGALAFEYLIRPEWLNPEGNLHGGVTAAIMDDVIGATIFL